MELVKICRESNFHFPPFPFLCFCFGWAGEEETVPWRKQKGNNLPGSERATAKTDPETKKNCLRKQTGTGRKAQDGNDYPWVKRENQQVEIPTQSRKGMFSDIQIVFFLKRALVLGKREPGRKQEWLYSTSSSEELHLDIMFHCSLLVVLRAWLRRSLLLFSRRIEG